MVDPVDRPSETMARKIQFCGISVRETTTGALVHFLERRLATSREPLAIGFANHNFILTCRPLASTFDTDRDTLILNDGIGMQLAAALRYGRGFRENMNGSDFIPHFLREAKGDLRIFLLGGTPEVVAKAAAVIDTMPRRRVVGYCDGFSFWSREDGIVGEINSARPDVLLVGLGNPRQERWILRHRRALRVGLVFGVGALFDWMSGAHRRAPAGLRRLRLEWLYRLTLEPKRLLKRYTVDAAIFFWLVVVRHR